MRWIVALVLAGTMHAAMTAESFELQRVIEAEGVSSGELYDRGRLWVSEAFASAEEVISFSDREAARIVGTGISPQLGGGGLFSIPLRVRYRFVFEARDGRARLTLTDVALWDPGSYTNGKAIETTNTRRNYPRVREHFSALVNDLRASLHESTKETW